MTSLDFQTLLKEERARQRAELTQQTSALQPHHSSAASLVRDAKVEASRNRRGRSPTRSSPCFLELAERPALDMVKMRVGETPSIFYVPDFITEVEEQEILSATYARDANGGSRSEWVSLRSRRLKCWGGEPGESFRPEPLPPWVEALCDALVVRGVFNEEDRPNHVLLNEYQAGQGIMAHTDGPFYRPRTATLSLGSDAIMHFSPRLAAADVGRPGVESRPQASLVLRPRCLVVFTEEAYSSQLHSIDAVTEETVGSATSGGGAPVINAQVANAPEGTILRRKLRISLTFRRVCRGTDGDEYGEAGRGRTEDQRETKDDLRS